MFSLTAWLDLHPGFMVTMSPVPLLGRLTMFEYSLLNFIIKTHAYSIIAPNKTFQKKWESPRIKKVL